MYYTPHKCYYIHYLQQYDSNFTQLITKSTILATLLYIYIGTTAITLQTDTMLLCAEKQHYSTAILITPITVSLKTIILYLKKKKYNNVTNIIQPMILLGAMQQFKHVSWKVKH